MAPHSSTLAWKIPWTEEPGGLQSMGSRRVRPDWVTSPFTFHFHALEKEMATHSSILAWRIPRTGEPGRLLSMGSHRVGHDWSNLAAAAAVAAATHVCVCVYLIHFAVYLKLTQSYNSAIVQWKKKLIPNIVHSLSRNLIIELLEVDAWNNQVSSHKQSLWHWVKPQVSVLTWVPQALALVVCLWTFVKAPSFRTLTSHIPFPSYHLYDAGNPWRPCQRGVILSPLDSPVKRDSCVAFL